jgi:hypothetical protein
VSQSSVDRPGVHLAPYAFGGGGGVFTGAGGNTIHTRFPELNREFNNASANVDNDRGLGHVWGGSSIGLLRISASLARRAITGSAAADIISIPQ